MLETVTSRPKARLMASATRLAITIDVDERRQQQRPARPATAAPTSSAVRVRRSHQCTTWNIRDQRVLSKKWNDDVEEPGHAIGQWLWRSYSSRGVTNDQ